MKRLAIVIVLVSLGSSAFAARRIIVDDDAKAELKSPKVAVTGNDMRARRRVGIGTQAVGALGLGGIIVELNFNDRSGIVGGFGGGSPAFQAWTVQYKRVLAGEWLLPYMSAGFARWNNFEPRPGIAESTPGILEERLMSQSDKQKGVINEYLLYPAFGIQYFQLSGEWAGFSMFAEFDILFDVVDFVAAPTGALGISYYF